MASKKQDLSLVSLIESVGVAWGLDVAAIRAEAKKILEREAARDRAERALAPQRDDVLPAGVVDLATYRRAR